MTTCHDVTIRVLVSVCSLFFAFYSGQAENFEHWLVMHFLKYVFWIIYNPKKATDFSFKFELQNTAELTVLWSFF